MSFFSHHNSSASERPFSIDDAFDIPEDDDDLMGGANPNGSSVAIAPIVKNGRLRLTSEDGGRASYAPGGRNGVPDGVDSSHGHPGGGGAGGDGGSTADSASLIQSGSGEGGGGGSGYYEGPPPLKYWWLHPKIRNNPKVVVAAFLLVILGLALIACGVAAYCIPRFQGIQGLVFIIAGLICFLPGAYHIVYIYLAVKGKRGFEFNHLPLFNN